jgi:hypothetical protein
MLPEVATALRWVPGEAATYPICLADWRRDQQSADCPGRAELAPRRSKSGPLCSQCLRVEVDDRNLPEHYRISGAGMYICHSSVHALKYGSGFTADATAALLSSLDELVAHTFDSDHEQKKLWPSLVEITGGYRNRRRHVVVPLTMLTVDRLTALSGHGSDMLRCAA